MMTPIDILLVMASAATIITGSSFYIRDILRGKTKPNLVSWLMWATAPLVATGAALAAGADLLASTRIFLSGLIPLIIVVVALFRKQSYWKLQLFDGLCGLSSVIALILWLLAQDPIAAITLAIVGDTLALFPTLRKAWIAPETETGLTFVFGIIATVLIIPTIPQWDIPNAGFQVYLLIANTLLIASIYGRPVFRHITRKRSSS